MMLRNGLLSRLLNQGMAGQSQVIVTGKVDQPSSGVFQVMRTTCLERLQSATTL
jgi:hypothetical protein